MIRLWSIFTIVIATTSTHIHANDNSESSQLPPTGIKITPFQLEIRARDFSQSQEQASIDLKSITEEHLTKYVKSKKANIWVNFDTISLYAEEEDMGTLHRKLRQNSRREQAATGNFKVLYSGNMLFLGSNANLPSKEQIDNVILGAFLGQAKIDYLSEIKASSDEFLSSSNYAKAWIPVDDTVGEVPSTSNNKLFYILAIVAGAMVGTSIMIAVYYLFYYDGGRRKSDHASLNDDKPFKRRRKSSSNEIRASSTRSMSPPPAKSSDKYKHLNQDNSIMSKDTIDVNGSVDMIAWKNRIDNKNAKAPFETDITMITNASPNKTIEVEIPQEIGGRKKSSSSSSGYCLSKGMLNQHNNRYSKHSNKRTGY